MLKEAKPIHSEDEAAQATSKGTGFPAATNYPLPIKEVLKSPVKLGDEQHHIVITSDEAGIAVELHSDIKSVDAIIKHLKSPRFRLATRGLSRLTHRYESVKSQVKAIDKGYQQLLKRRDLATMGAADRDISLSRKEINKKKAAEMGLSEEDFLGAVRVSRSLIKVKDQINLKRAQRSDLLFRLKQEASVLVEQLWDQYEAYLAIYLMPSKVLNRELPIDPNAVNVNEYHRGTQNDPIPIVWYKRLDAYPRVKELGGGIKSLSQGATIAAGVKIGGNYIPQLIQKVAHNSKRARQKALNGLINSTPNVAVIDSNGHQLDQPMGEAKNQGYDGDHVLDLGFGGRDVDNNYWPLDAGINRRGFNGYNNLYRVHYRDGNTIKKKAIGGLVGKYFTVKGFMPNASNKNYPQESDSESAGKA